MGKRKTGAKRYPNGTPYRHEEEPRTNARYRRIRDNLDRMGADPAIGTFLGSLWYHKSITSGQFEAGKAFARLRAYYLPAIGSRPETAKAMDYDVSYGLPIPPMVDGDHVEDQCQCRDCRAKKLINRYTNVSRALDAIGPNVHSVLVSVCSLDEPVGSPARMLDLKKGLTMLVDYFRLEGAMGDRAA